MQAETECDQILWQFKKHLFDNNKTKKVEFEILLFNVQKRLAHIGSHLINCALKTEVKNN